MQSEPNLKMQCPEALLDPGAGRMEKMLRSIGLRPPFFFPWSIPVRMSGAAISELGVSIARGRLVGQRFQVDSVAFIAGTNMMLGIFEGNKHPGEPVCVGLPRERTFVRYFQVPAESESEIEAMLPHLLAGELPSSLEQYSWVWAPVKPSADGKSLISVYIARNDILEAFLSPVRESGFRVVGLVPEGWAWCHAIRQARSKDYNSAPSSVIIRGDSGPYLVVQQSGRLLFDAVLDPSILKDQDIWSNPEEGSLDWGGVAMAGVRRKFQELFEMPLPWPEIWPDALDLEDNAQERPVFFSASVASCGIENPRLMIPEALRRRNRRSVFFQTLKVLGRLSLIGALAWLAFMMVEDGQNRSYLGALNQQISEEHSEIETLEAELNAVRENTRQRAGNAEILQALASLRRNLAPPIYLEHLNYVRGSGITLRGGARDSRQVLEMTDTLALDSLWRGLRVTQIRSEQVSKNNQVHFVVEGQLNQ